MTSEPLVSVIVPTKNSGKFLEACLKSIKEQTYKNIEIVVVDQESDDSTQEIAMRFGVKLIITQPSEVYTPPTRSRNMGAKDSKGEILYHLDSDMVLPPRLIEEAVTILRGDDSLGALIVHEKDITGGFWSKVKALERRCYWGDDNIESARIVRRTIFEIAGGYDEGISSGEDFDIHRRYKKCSKIGYCENTVSHDLRNLTFFRFVGKKFHYGKSANEYFNKYSESGVSIITEQLRCYARSYKLFVKHPSLTLGMIFMKSCEVAAGGLGLLLSNIK